MKLARLLDLSEKPPPQTPQGVRWREHVTQEYPRIRQKLWKEYFWSRSFCLLTTGGAPIEVIRRYIENQGRK